MTTTTWPAVPAHGTAHAASRGYFPAARLAEHPGPADLAPAAHGASVELDAVEVARAAAAPPVLTPASPWFVVVERYALDTGADLPPYVVGPYATLAAAEEEGNSDAGLVFCLLTIDAKAERYVAHDCWWTQLPPAGDQIIPD